jgi:hypothetical protein
MRQRGFSTEKWLKASQAEGEAGANVPRHNFTWCWRSCERFLCLRDDEVNKARLRSQNHQATVKMPASFWWWISQASMWM